jgi:hypothetical protein
MKNTPWRRTFKNVDHLNKWAEENDSVEIHGTRDLEQAKKGNLSPAIREDLDEAKLASPLKGHVYHTKSDAELRGIVKDAGETARVQKGMSSEGKYLDQMNDASTVLHYRSKGGKQIIATNPRMAASKQTDGSIKAKWHKNESLDEAHKLGDRVKIVGGVSKDLIGVHGHIGEIRNGPFKGAPKTYTVDYQHPKHASSHTSSIQLSKDHIRGAKSGTLEEDLDEDASDAAKFNAKIKQASEASSAGRHTHAKMHLDNARILMTAVKSSDLSKIQDSYKQYRDLRVKYPYKKPVMEEDLDEDASDAAKFNAKIKQASEASSAGRHTHAKMHLDNARILMTAVKSSDLSKIQDSYKQYRDLRVKYPYKKPVMVESAEKLTEISLQMNIDAHAKRSSEDVVEGSIEEVSTTLLKSYAEKAREDAEKLTKQGDRAKTDTTKLSKYVKATKRHLNAHKADDKISSNEFYGKK